jgi:enamine deaminase RidA (YjgF/YER057c/UK114 family)
MTNVEHFTRESMKPLLEPYGLVEAVMSGSTLTLGGQTGINEQHQVVEGGLKAQAAQAFKNIKAVLELADSRVEHLTHLTWYLVESANPKSFLEDAVEVTAAQEEVMPDLKCASTAVRVKALLLPELLIEIQATAVL